MSQSAIIFPVVCQVLLTFFVLIAMARARGRSMKALGQKMEDKDIRLGQNAWSEEAVKASNNYKNQFEIPVLFYAACAFALMLRQADGLITGLAWVFALSRIVHAILHIGPNVVPPRGAAFLVGVIAVMAMWLILGWRVWTGTLV